LLPFDPIAATVTTCDGAEPSFSTSEPFDSVEFAPMTVEALRARVKHLMPRAWDDLAQMVALRSVYDPRARPPEDCRRMVDLTVARFAEVGVRDVEAHVTSDGSQVVCGHTPGPPGTPTALLYFHHDVQPPLDDAAWTSPPWELTERDGRWYGRGAADCKGNLVAHLTALRAFRGDFPVGIKIVGEGSEELGDGGLENFVPNTPICFEPT
jgi:acetylornithine deacetylase/succinyl-diaminopimelate desuccinylase-like protein